MILFVFGDAVLGSFELYMFVFIYLFSKGGFWVV